MPYQPSDPLTVTLTSRADATAHLTRLLAHPNRYGLDMHLTATYHQAPPKPFGSIGGHPLTIASQGGRLTIALAHQPSIAASIALGDPLSPAGILARVENLPGRLPALADTLQVRRDTLQQRADAARQLLGAPSPHLAALEAAQQRYQAIETRIAHNTLTDSLDQLIDRLHPTAPPAPPATHEPPTVDLPHR